MTRPNNTTHTGVAEALLAPPRASGPTLEAVYARQCLPAPFPGGRLMALLELERSMRGQQVPEWLKQR